MFPYGYGLTYADRRELALLSEQRFTVINPNQQHNAGQIPLFLRNLAPGLAFTLTDQGGLAVTVTTPFGVSNDGKSLTMQSVNLSYQEDGRQLRWDAGQPVQASLRFTKTAARKDFTSANTLRFSMRLDQQQSEKLQHPARLELAVLCDAAGACQRQLNLDETLATFNPGIWQQIEVDLDCLPTPARDAQLQDAVVFSGSGRFSLAVADITLINTALADSSRPADSKPLRLGCGAGLPRNKTTH